MIFLVLLSRFLFTKRDYYDFVLNQCENDLLHVLFYIIQSHAIYYKKQHSLKKYWISFNRSLSGGRVVFSLYQSDFLFYDASFLFQ